MKKLVLFALILFVYSVGISAQIVKIDIDSLVEGSEIISRKWNNKPDSVRVIEIKTLTVYGDSSAGNVTIVLEWKLDTAKSVKIREDNIKNERRKKLAELQEAVDKFKAKNPNISKPNAAKQAQTIMVEPPPPPKPKKPKK